MSAGSIDTADSDGHDEHHGPDYLAHHFETPVQQFDAAKLGMWLFLAQEVLFFSALFLGYTVFRGWFPEAYSVGAHELDWSKGGINTLVLLFSSVTAVLAVRSAQSGEQKKTSMYLLITIACAFGFLIIKYFEYTHKFHLGVFPGKFFDPVAATIGETVYGQECLAALDGVNLAADQAKCAAGMKGVEGIGSFFSLYFMATGVHGIHVTVGIGVLFWIWLRNNRGEFTKEFWTPVDLVALYWHLVDLIWIYLFPLLYLID